MALTDSVFTNVDATMTNATTEMMPADVDAGSDSMNELMTVSQTIMTTVGSIANLATMFILIEASGTSAGFSGGYLLLLRCQAFWDFMVCTISTVMMLQTPMWTTGIYALDSIICHLWHGQAIYWVWVLTSIWNLVMVAYERALAICYPFKHVDLTIRHVWRLVVIAVSIGWGANALCFIQVRMKGSVCVSEYLILGVPGQWTFFFYGQVIFIVYWLLPVILFCIFYGKVLATLFARRDSSSFGESTLVNTATAQMTKTAIAVTIIFIISMSWDVWYYLLGRTGVVPYIKNTFLQLIGVWLSAFNSLANPFVYFILLPAFRKATISTMLCCVNCGRKRRSKDTPHNTA